MMAYKKILSILGIAIFLGLLSFTNNFVEAQSCRNLEVQIPGLTSTCLPALPDYIMAIYNFSLMIVGIICFAALVYGGFRYLASAGNPTAISDARDQISSAILGLIILLSAWLILNTINPELVILSQPGTIACASDADCPSGQLCVAGICSVYPTIGGGSWGSDCSSYSVEADCQTNGCVWCTLCSGNQVNSWKADKCITLGSCGYGYEVGQCGVQCTGTGACTKPDGTAGTCQNYVCL